jgi:hypothetical protein
LHDKKNRPGDSWRGTDFQYRHTGKPDESHSPTAAGSFIELVIAISLLVNRKRNIFMNLRIRREYLLIFCILALFFLALFSGCIQNPAVALENPGNGSISQAITNNTGVSLDNPSVLHNSTGTGVSGSPKNDTIVRSTLDADWRIFRIINMDLTTRYLTLDLSKSDDINYLRYSLLPRTIGNLSDIRDDLETIQPSTPDEENETRTLITMTNYTILKYETLSEMLHSTQYANMRDPVMLKSEIRNAKLSVMDALDIVNSNEIDAYPSKYRDQIAADKRELDDMMSQIDSYTRTIYQPPTD